MNYYRRFIKNFSAIADPLLEKLKKSELKDDEEFEVTPAMEKSFQELKSRLMTAPILAHPRFDDLDNNPFQVTVDWSAENNSVGGTLEQRINGTMRVIAYAARRLSPAQKSYSATKGELAAVLILLDIWRWYLLMRPFILRTDHAAIVHLRNFKNPTGQMSRWQQRLESFSFTVEHIRGQANGAADALSRAEHLKFDPKENLDPFEEKEELQTLNALPASISLLEGEVGTWRMLRDTQEEDEDLKVIRSFLVKGTKPDKDAFNVASSKLKTYMGLFDSLFLDTKGILRYRYPFVEHPGTKPKERVLLVLPEDLAYDAVKAVHERGAHMAVDATASRALQYVYCHNMLEVAGLVVRRCMACQMARKKPKDQRHTLYSPLQGYAFQRVTVDYVGPLQPARGTGCRYIITIQDSFSRWLEGFAVKTATAKTTLEILNREILSRFGMIESVHSDRGTHFTAHAVRDACKILNVPWTYTPALNPKSSRVESSHRTLGRMLTALTKGKQDLWQVYLPAALFAIRSSTNRTTGFAPYRLLFGREVSTDLETMFARPNTPEEFRDYEDYAIKLKDRIHQAFKWAQENIGGAIRRQRRAYCQAKKKYTVGQQVWLFTPRRKIGESSKYRVYWTGPWSVVRVVNDLTYEISPHPSWPRKGQEVVSIDRLMPFYSDREDGDDAAAGEVPSQHDDLGMEGDEFAEQIRLPYIDDDDDDILDLPPGVPGGGPQPPPPAQPPAPPPPPPSPPQSPPPLQQPQPQWGLQGLPQAEAQPAQPVAPQAAQLPPRPLLQPARLFLPGGAEGGGARPGRLQTPPRPGTPHPQFGVHSPLTFHTPEGQSPRRPSPRPPLSARRKQLMLQPRMFSDVEEVDEPPPPLPTQEGRDEDGAETQETAAGKPADAKRGKGLKVREGEYRREKEAEEKAKKEERGRRDDERAARRREREEKQLEGRLHGLEPDLDLD